MRVHKNYYNFSFGSYCGVFIDEKTMRKIAKIQARTYHEVMEVLENAEDIHVANWSIADEPATVDHSKRFFEYIGVKEDESLKWRLESVSKNMFSIDKVKDLYSVDGEDIVEERKLAQKAHEEYLRETLSEEELKE